MTCSFSYRLGSHRGKFVDYFDIYSIVACVCSVGMWLEHTYFIQ